MEPRYIVVGGGLAGLMATIKICEAGGSVDLFSLVAVKRSHSVCAQGGINGAVNTKGEGDSTWEHFDDSVYGGDFLANQTPVKEMCEAAPGIIFLMDRMGVPFSRTPEGLLDFRRFGGTKHHRTAFSGATTGQQLIYACDEQVRRWEVAGKVRKYEGWDVISAVLDKEGICRGIVAQNLVTMEIKVFRGDAVNLATGGPGMIYGRSTQSVICTGSIAGQVYQQGAYLGNPEMIQVHPTAIPGADKLRLMSESARGEGGRVWTYRDGKPWYFLEDMFPAYGNLVPRDIATRAIYQVCYDMKLGVDGQPVVYLDLTHIDAATLDRKLGGILEIYEKFIGDDPRKVPMKIFPAVHYSMGGLWVDFDAMTNIPGLFASGEADYQYHGANRLGANSLLSAIYGGMVSGPAMMQYAQGLKKSCADIPQSVFDAELKRQQNATEKLYNMRGNENPYLLHKELGEWMSEHCTIVRYNKNIQKLEEHIQVLMERYQKLGLPDTGRYANQSVIFARNLWNMLEYGRAIAVGALNRNESRGSHYKPEFPERDDENFLKTTKAKWTPNGPALEWEEVDVQYIKPRPRRYDVDKEASK
ncbi:MAG: succinate dehydrogenase flavoprotein subunit [Heliobacteriaceae bacterium]|nr:succinate dehydrogenase flavoprotein subunit [Heliobacteriaceae bacterium]